MSDTVQLNVDGNDTGDSVTFMTHEISGTDRPEEMRNLCKYYNAIVSFLQRRGNINF